ncbi:hypothetical protein C8J57DRAFT_1519613 [Mycena rebaudengoi]|nr:hypothetical protein C8J57DRAFT_1519613 [Mycena rebaudengoi]
MKPLLESLPTSDAQPPALCPIFRASKSALSLPYLGPPVPPHSYHHNLPPIRYSAAATFLTVPGAQTSAIDAIRTSPSEYAVWLISRTSISTAWGTLSGSGFNSVINVTNYELGVVIPIATCAEADAAVAWERPARKYAPKDIPWYPPLVLMQGWEGGQVEESFAVAFLDFRIARTARCCVIYSIRRFLVLLERITRILAARQVPQCSFFLPPKRTRETVLEFVFINQIFLTATDAPAPDMTDFWLADIFVEIGKRTFRFLATFFKDNQYSVDDSIYRN